MNTQRNFGGAPKPFIFSTDDGFKLCRQILEAYLPYIPHDFQTEGLCKVLDHIDLFFEQQFWSNSDRLEAGAS